VGGPGLRALVYSGDCDLVIPHPGTELWTGGLGLRMRRSRPWRLHDYVRARRARAALRLGCRPAALGGAVPAAAPASRVTARACRRRRWPGT